MYVNPAGTMAMMTIIVDWMDQTKTMEVVV